MKRFLLIILILSKTVSANGLKLAVSQNKFPYEYVQNNKVIGITADIANYIFKKIKIQVQLIPMSEKRKASLIEHGVILDGVVGTELDGNQNYYTKLIQTKPIFGETHNVYQSKEKNLKVKNIEDLKGTRIGILTTNEYPFRFYGIEHTKIDFKKVSILQSTNDLLVQIEENELDLIISESLALNIIAKKLNLTKCCKIIQTKGTTQLRIGLVKKRLGKLSLNIIEKFNNALKQEDTKLFIAKTVKKYKNIMSRN